MDKTNKQTKAVMSRPNRYAQTTEASLSYELREASRRRSEVWDETGKEGQEAGGNEANS